MLRTHEKSVSRAPKVTLAKLPGVLISFSRDNLKWHQYNLLLEALYLRQPNIQEEETLEKVPGRKERGSASDQALKEGKEDTGKEANVSLPLP